jgi:N-acetylmuramoyl-L-alanine amidase
MKKYVVLLILSISVLFASCSQKGDKEYSDAAQKFMDSKNYYEALTNYQKIVDEYPESKYYQDALLQTGELTQGYIDKKLSKTESLLKAIKIYREYCDKYPDSPKAPQTLFMIGFIEANELDKIEEAKATYNEFLKKYPKSEMVKAAKAEIENLGLTPDQILEKQREK